MKAEIEQVLSNCYPRNWDEDYITRAMISALRDKFSNTILDIDKKSGKDVKTAWDIYKNTTKHKMEQHHGDIGVLVKIQFTKDCALEGVAFIEAKKIYHDQFDDNKSKYDALSWSQLTRVSANSSCHRTLLYDIAPNKRNYPLALTLPTKHLMALNDNSREINQYCEDFSYCLSNRYFQGYELDYDKDRVDAVKGILNLVGGVKYLLVSHVTMSLELEPSLETVEFNRQVFRRVETPNLQHDDEPDDTLNNSNSPSM